MSTRNRNLRNGKTYNQHDGFAAVPNIDLEGIDPSLKEFLLNEGTSLSQQQQLLKGLEKVQKNLSVDMTNSNCSPVSSENKENLAEISKSKTTKKKKANTMAKTKAAVKKSSKLGIQSTPNILKVLPNKAQENKVAKKIDRIIENLEKAENQPKANLPNAKKRISLLKENEKRNSSDLDRTYNFDPTQAVKESQVQSTSKATGKRQVVSRQVASSSRSISRAKALKKAPGKSKEGNKRIKEIDTCSIETFESQALITRNPKRTRSNASDDNFGEKVSVSNENNKTFKKLAQKRQKSIEKETAGVEDSINITVSAATEAPPPPNSPKLNIVTIDPPKVQETPLEETIIAVQRKIVNKPVQKEKVQPKLRPKTQPKQPRKSRTIRKSTNVINTINDNTEKSTNTRNTRNSKRLSSKKIEMEQQEQIEKMKIMAMNAKKHSTTEEKSTFNIDKPTVSNYSAIHVHESNGREILETRTTDHPSDQSERKSSEIETVEKVTVSTVTEELLTKTPKNSTQNKNHNKQENGKENNKSSTQELMNSAASKLFFHVGLSEKDLNYSPITNLDTSRENLDQDQNSKNSLQNTPKINSKSRQDTNLTAAENKNKIANERSPTPTPTKNPNNSPITQNSNNFEGVDPSSPSPFFGVGIIFFAI